jgi:transcriptional regulator
LCNEGEDVAALVRELTERFEGAGSGAWRPEALPVDFRASLLGAIVGFEIALERLEGKFKLSQNRSAADRAGVIAELGTDRSDASRELAALMRSAG